MVEEMLATRGICVTYETVRQWERKFGKAFADQIRQRAPARGDKWHMDGGRKMARIRRHSHAIAAALLGLVAFAPALAEDQGSKNTDLYEGPTLAVDPGMHTAKINAQAVDAAGRFAITGGDDRTVRVAPSTAFLRMLPVHRTNPECALRVEAV
jgi:hypothetical protein